MLNLVPLHREPVDGERDGLATSLVRWIGRLAIGVFVGHGGSPRARRARSARSLFMQHFFVSGVRALPLCCVVAFGTGAATVLQTMMAPEPPSGEFGRMLVVVMVRELAPLLTAVLMAGHSATAMAAELAPWALAVRGGAPRLGPRLAGTAGASTALAVHFAAVAMLGAFAVSQLLTLRTFDAVSAGVQQELHWFDLPLFLLKTTGLGAIVGWFGCRFALQAKASPVEVARGASRAFVASLMAGAVYSIGITFALYGLVGPPAPP